MNQQLKTIPFIQAWHTDILPFDNIQVIWLLSVLLLEKTEENHADLR
jgi:hypothetical protein